MRSNTTAAYHFNQKKKIKIEKKTVINMTCLHVRNVTAQCLLNMRIYIERKIYMLMMSPFVLDSEVMAFSTILRFSVFLILFIVMFFGSVKPMCSLLGFDNRNKWK